MTELHIFTEEPSIEKVFQVLLPQILTNEVSFYIHSHQGKQDLEKALQTTVPSISKMPNAKILITRDQDNDECKLLKNKLLEIIDGKCICDFFIRIICKELESWFLCDLQAVEKAYPRFRAQQYSNKSRFRNVDAINKPSDLLCKIIPDYSHCKKLPKLEIAQKISEYLDLNSNKSTSFNNTINAVRRLVQ